MAEHRILQLHQVLHPAARATAANTATPPAAPALTSVGIRLTAPALARHKHFTAADLPTEWHQQAGLVVGFFERNGFNRHGATVVGNKLGESFEVRAPAPAGGSLAGAGRARGRQRLCTGPQGRGAAPQRRRSFKCSTLTPRPVACPQGAGEPFRPHRRQAQVVLRQRAGHLCTDDFPGPGHRLQNKVRRSPFCVPGCVCSVCVLCAIACDCCTAAASESAPRLCRFTAAPPAPPVNASSAC